MVKVDGWLQGQGDQARMIMQVHDELVFETESEFLDTLRLKVVELMSSSAQLRVPLVVDAGVGDNWDEAH
jgi:DNA polymerase-1